MDKKELCTDDLTIIKKNGLHVKWNPDKILIATGKSAARVLVTFSDEEKDTIIKIVTQKILDLHKKEITIDDMHAAVEAALDVVNPAVAKSYRNFRDYKATLNQITEGVITEENRIRYLGDKSNANKDAKLVATKRSLIYGEWATRMYEKFHLTPEELEAATAGYIYIHDKDSRADTMNCFDRSTRFITDRGVMSFYDFTDGDEVMVISHTGKWRKAVVHSYGMQKLQKVIFASDEKKKEIIVTPNHRWILKDGKETTDINIGDELIQSPDIPGYESRTWIVSDIEKSDEEMPVWCLVVEEDHSFLLEDAVPTGNCCLFDMKTVMSGGFEMGNMWYNEPNSLDTAFDVMGDIILATAAQQYGK